MSPLLSVLRIGVAFVLQLVVLTESVRAQEDVLESDPLRARKLLIYDQVGGFGGLSLNGQTGTLVTDCNCEFQGGAATGYVIGGLFERLTRSRITWGVSLGYEDRSISGRFREIEGVIQRAPSNGLEYTVPIEFLHEANVSLGYLTATPFLKYVAFEALFVRAGAAISYVVSTNVKHTKSLASDTVRFPNGESATVQFPDAESGTSIVLQDGPISDVQPLQISASLGVGAEIRLSKTMFLAPVIQYVYPFTTISSSAGDFSTQALQIMLELRFII